METDAKSDSSNENPEYSAKQEFAKNKNLFFAALVAAFILLAGVYTTFDTFKKNTSQKTPVPDNVRDMLTPTQEQEMSPERSDEPDQSNRSSNGCIISGCNEETCSEEEVSTICVYHPVFECYRNATCARQEDGECGWIMTDSLVSCLEDNVAEPSL